MTQYPPVKIDDAYLKARQVMLQARNDLEKIAGRLQQSGYQFAYPKYVFEPPTGDIRARIEELEALIGPLPIFLRAAFEFLGSWNFMGDHPDWPKSAHVRLRPVKNEQDVWFTDPFVFCSLQMIWDDTEGWDGSSDFLLSFSGDAMTKAGYSGGLYSIKIPSQEADPLILGEEEKLSFIEYLRQSLRYGGFAGFEKIPERPQKFINILLA